MDVARFKQLPILAILRGIKASEVEPLIEAVVSSGLKTIEFTMNTDGAASLIRKAVVRSKNRLAIGAGTVLDMKSLRAALDSGATFIVMPVMVKDVTAFCVKHRIPVFPGALTPQEIDVAWRAGATMVKVFPSSCFGPEYFKEIKGPFQDIKLLATGGVRPENLKDYFACGADAVSFGASVFKKEWLAQKDFAAITQAIASYVQEFQKMRR